MNLPLTALALIFGLTVALDSSNSAQVDESAADAPAAGPFTLPIIDLDDRPEFHVVVDCEPGQYLGHPTTVLLEDGKTILCVYPKGHGQGGVVYKRSSDGGKTWSERLPTPDNWATSREVPTLHRVVDAAGKRRLIMWSGLYPARLAVSEDDGATWGPLEPAGEWGGIVVMGSLLELNTPGHYMAMFHDDGRFLSADAKREDPVRFKLLKTFSLDGGLTWSSPEVVWTGTDLHLCEPGAIKSADGKRIAVLLRENRRKSNSQLIISDDDGATFSDPRPLPAALTGDRHTGVRTPDGRLFISFRDVSPAGWDSPTEGDWVAWVGTFDDLINGREGQYRVRLKDNRHAWDCAYPGVVTQPDGTIVTTTYGHWDEGEQPYIRSVRLKLTDLDRLATGAQDE